MKCLRTETSVQQQNEEAVFSCLEVWTMKVLQKDFQMSAASTAEEEVVVPKMPLNVDV